MSSYDNVMGYGCERVTVLYMRERPQFACNPFRTNIEMAWNRGRTSIDGMWQLWVERISEVGRGKAKASKTPKKLV